MEPFENIAAIFTGLLVGSFLNVVIYRLPRHESLAFPASRCPHCGHGLRPWENIPVMSWLLLRGRCSACGSAIAWRYPLVELLAALLAWLAFSRAGPGWQVVPDMVFLWALLALTIIDLETRLLPDRITKPGMAAGLLLNVSGLIWPGLGLTSPLGAVLGLLLGYGVLRLLGETYARLKGHEGMGHGDFKLLGMIGAWLGWQSMFLAIFIAAISGGTVALFHLARGKGKEYAMPFGPYLALGGALMLLWPHEITDFYLHMLGI